jgi:hypothetical protein
LDLLEYARREVRAQLRAAKLAQEGKSKEELDRALREMDESYREQWQPPTETDSIKQFNSLSMAASTFSLGQPTQGMPDGMKDDLRWAEEMTERVRNKRRMN